MGTSIHMHIEVKDGSQWHHYASPHMYRDRTFFQLLANVYPGSQITPLSFERGLPEDISFVTRHDYKQDCENYAVHHESWLSSSEIEELQQRLNEIYRGTTKPFREYDLEDHYFNTMINGNPVFLHQGWDDVRFIFWFDN